MIYVYYYDIRARIKCHIMQDIIIFTISVLSGIQVRILSEEILHFQGVCCCEDYFVYLLFTHFYGLGLRSAIICNIVFLYQKVKLVNNGFIIYDFICFSKYILGLNCQYHIIFYSGVLPNRIFYLSSLYVSRDAESFILSLQIFFRSLRLSSSRLFQNIDVLQLFYFNEILFEY